MKKILLIAALVFGLLSVICGLCYTGIVISSLVKKVKARRDQIMERLKIYVLEHS